MPGIIGALAEARTPFSILTKGTLLRRDLPLLVEAAGTVDVQLAMSIAIFDDELQATMEPGTPTTAARLATVAAAADAGFQVAVFMMPILPFLTDGEAHLNAALTRIKAAGATQVTYSSLHLRPGVKEWFARWLNTYRPDLTPRYRRLYGDGAYAPKEYRRHLASVIRPLIAAHGLAQAETDPGTGSATARAEARDRNGEWRRARAGSRAQESSQAQETDASMSALF
jgi:DNA repair photolyase